MDHTNGNGLPQGLQQAGGALGSMRERMLGATEPQYNGRLNEAKSDRERGSLEREIDAYANNLDSFERLLTNLATRVAVVSRSADAPRGSSGKSVPTPASQIASIVQTQNQRFEGLLEALAYVTERIDL